MSNKAINWAKKQKLRSSVKNLLIILADHANDQNLCWPSHEKLRQSTGLERKTIIRAFAILQEFGLISDTGRRTGKSGRVKIYYLNLDVNVGDERGDSMSPLQSSRFGAPIVPKTFSNSPEFLGQQSQNRDAEPSPNHHSTFIEPKRGGLQRRSSIEALGIERFLDDDDLQEVRRIAPGRDKHVLFNLYDDWTKNKGAIRNQKKAFFGWLIKFIKNKPLYGYQAQYGDGEDY